MGHLSVYLRYRCRQLFCCLNCYREAWSCLRTWWSLTWLSRESADRPLHSNRDWNSSLTQEMHKMSCSRNSHCWSVNTSTPRFKSWTRSQCFQGFWSCSWSQLLLSLRTFGTLVPNNFWKHQDCSSRLPHCQLLIARVHLDCQRTQAHGWISCNALALSTGDWRMSSLLGAWQRNPCFVNSRRFTS